MGSMDLFHPLSRASAPPKVGFGPASRDSTGHVIGVTVRFQEVAAGLSKQIQPTEPEEGRRPPDHPAPIQAKNSRKAVEAGPACFLYSAVSLAG